MASHADDVHAKLGHCNAISHSRSARRAQVNGSGTMMQPVISASPSTKPHLSATDLLSKSIQAWPTSARDHMCVNSEPDTECCTSYKALTSNNMCAGSILPYAALWHLGFAAWAFSVFKTFASVGSGLQPFRRFVISQGLARACLP